MSKRENVLNLGVETIAAMLLTGILAGSMFVSPLPAQSTAASGTPAVASAPKHYRPDRFAGRAGKYYALVWGIDSLSVKVAESGELIRFSYAVLDANKASPLNDKKFEPKLIAPDAHAILVIPSLEKVGQLRQSTPPEAGKSYWMAFSNPRRTVKRGDKVNVMIGQFRADGLIIE
jgi:hypothetical protein